MEGDRVWVGTGGDRDWDGIEMGWDQDRVRVKRWRRLREGQDWDQDWEQGRRGSGSGLGQG